MAQAPLLLCVLDGWGENPNWYGNAVRCARTPVFDDLVERYPRTYLRCQGEAVGLRDGLMGNSEVGHENLGAGRIVAQEILFIDRAIDDGSFFDKPAFVAAAEQARRSGGRLHLCGLLSDGGVHSAEKHYLALLELALRHGLTGDRCVFHAILDGRDTDPHSGAGYLATLEAEMARLGVGVVGSLIGRYWAMDRDHRWHRTRLAYDAICLGGNGTTAADTNPDGKDLSAPFRAAASASAALADCYATGSDKETDEFLWPIIITDDAGQPRPRLADGDGFVFFNFRGDRPRQILRALNDDDFAGFARVARPKVALASVCQYDSTLLVPFGFKRERPAEVLGEVLAGAGLTQLRAAETEKYPHVSFFFNNQLETPYPGEERLMVKSPPVATYDLQPEMSAWRLAGAVADELHRFDVAVLNFANPDMVGHTGVFEAAVRACEAVDRALGLVLGRLRALGGRAIVTADHGNAEEMINYAMCRRENGTLDYTLRIPHTTHTPANLTPCVLVDDTRLGATLRCGGCLGDVAPTMLKLLGLRQPGAMSGESLL